MLVLVLLLVVLVVAVPNLMNTHIVPQHFLGNDVKAVLEHDRKVIGNRLDLFNSLGVSCRSLQFVYQQSPADG